MFEYIEQLIKQLIGYEKCDHCRRFAEHLSESNCKQICNRCIESTKTCRICLIDFIDLYNDPRFPNRCRKCLFKKKVKCLVCQRDIVYDTRLYKSVPSRRCDDCVVLIDEIDNEAICVTYEFEVKPYDESMYCSDIGDIE